MDNEITINRLYREELDPRLYDLISELRNKFGNEGRPIKGRLYVSIIDDPSYKPNLTGAAIIHLTIPKPYFTNELTITRGIFKRLDLERQSDELETLIAHEFSHIINKDSFVAGTLKILCFVSILILGLVGTLLENVVISIFIVIIGVVMVGRIFHWWYRRIEARCDREAVIITKNPEASQRALNRIFVNFADIRDEIRTRDKPLIY